MSGSATVQPVGQWLMVADAASAAERPSAVGRWIAPTDRGPSGPKLTFADLSAEDRAALRGAPLTWDDLTDAEKASLRGPPLTWADLTDDEKASLRGAPLTWADLTASQIASLKGDPFIYADFTPDQLAALKGDPFRYGDFTPSQLAALQGAPGKSAYQDWLDGGNAGSFADFLRVGGLPPVVELNGDKSIAQADANTLFSVKAAAPITVTFTTSDMRTDIASPVSFVWDPGYAGGVKFAGPFVNEMGYTTLAQQGSRATGIFIAGRWYLDGGMAP